MKNIIYLSIALAAAGSLYAFRPAPRAAREPAPAVASAAASAAPAPLEKAAPAGPDLSPGASPLPYDPALTGVEGLNEEEVEKEITLLDQRFENEKWAERANRGALSPAEMLRLRTLLHHRNRLFERKLDLAGV